MGRLAATLIELAGLQSGRAVIRLAPRCGWNGLIGPGWTSRHCCPCRALRRPHRQLVTFGISDASVNNSESYGLSDS